MLCPETLFWAALASAVFADAKRHLLFVVRRDLAIALTRHVALFAVDGVAIVRRRNLFHNLKEGA